MRSRAVISLRAWNRLRRSEVAARQLPASKGVNSERRSPPRLYGGLTEGQVNVLEDLRGSLARAAPWARLDGLHLELRGQLPSGKNRQILRATGANGAVSRHPAVRFERWRADAARQLLVQLQAWRILLPIAVPVLLYVWYWPGDRITRDRSGIQDALYHLFEWSGIVRNDKWIEDPIWRTMPLDRTAPRTHLVIRPLIPISAAAPMLSPQFIEPKCPCCWYPLSA